MKLGTSPHHRVVTPSSVTAVRGLGGSGGRWLAGAFAGFCPGVGALAGWAIRSIFVVSCATVGVSSCFPVSLERTACPQVGPLDPVNESSKRFYHCTWFPWALVLVPALVFG